MLIYDFITINDTLVAVNNATAPGIATQNTSLLACTYEYFPWDHPNAKVLHTFQKDHKKIVDGQLLEKYFYFFL